MSMVVMSTIFFSSAIIALIESPLRYTRDWVLIIGAGCNFALVIITTILVCNYTFKQQLPKYEQIQGPVYKQILTQ